MNETRHIPFGKPWITDEDRQAVMEVLQGSILTHGPQGKLFEEEFAVFIEGENQTTEAYCVTVSSGMAALHMAYWQLGIGTGDEVIVTAQTHNATAHAIEILGAKPVFIDCRLDTGNIDVQQIEQAITPRTKAISLVHFIGIPCEMDGILDIAQRHGLKVIEDCAIALGARFRGVHVGLLGDAGCFSFYPVKHITSGEGGMFITRHVNLAQRVAHGRAFGVDRTHAERAIPGFYDVTAVGLNYRMSEMQAALGRQQLKRIDEILARRKANFSLLKTLLSELDEITILDSVTEQQQSSHYCLSLLLKGDLGKKRNEIVLELNRAGVGTSIYYPHPVPLLTYYRQKYGYREQDFPNALTISDTSIALPVAPHVSEEDIRYMAAHLKQIIWEVK